MTYDENIRELNLHITSAEMLGRDAATVPLTLLKDLKRERSPNWDSLQEFLTKYEMTDWERRYYTGKIPFIRFVRSVGKFSLKDAKQMVEEMMAEVEKDKEDDRRRIENRPGDDQHRVQSSS